MLLQINKLFILIPFFDKRPEEWMGGGERVKLKNKKKLTWAITNTNTNSSLVLFKRFFPELDSYAPCHSE